MPTLSQYTHALATDTDMGGYLPLTASSTSADGLSVVCSSLITSTTGLNQRYGGQWLFGIAGGSNEALSGIQREISPTGYDATTGKLTVIRAFGSTPQTGHKWELYPRLPAIQDDKGKKGLREIINEALSFMVCEDEISIAGVTSQTKYQIDLTTYPWLRERNRLQAIRMPRPNTNDLILEDPTYWDLLPDGEKLYLQIRSGTFQTGETFFLKVQRPANSRLASGGVWTDQSSLEAGLSAQTDEAIPSINDVVAVARAIAFDYLSAKGPDDQAAWWAKKAEEASVGAGLVKWANQEPTSFQKQVHYTGNYDLSVFR